MKINFTLNKETLEKYYNYVLLKEFLVFILPLSVLFTTGGILAYVFLKKLSYLLIPIIAELLFMLLTCLINNSSKRVALKQLENSYFEYLYELDDETLKVIVGFETIESIALNEIKIRSLFKFYYFKTKNGNYLMNKTSLDKEYVKNINRRRLPWRES